jgi:rhodanese-related sulfurtransferase
MVAFLLNQSFRSQLINRSILRPRPRPIAATSHRQVVAMSVSVDSLNRKKALDEIVEGLNTKFSSVPHLSPKAVTDLQAAGTPVIFIDTRSKEENDVSMIPGSFTIEEFESREQEFLSKNTKIIAYCTVGYRSSQYVEKVRKRGIDVSNLQGSILAWTHEGLPLVTKDKTTGQEVPTNKVHVFTGGRWLLQADGYEPVAFKHGVLSYVQSAISSTFSKLVFK